ncbi:hypothetical protein MATR_09800 [Marivirga tractuosa]|uniref:Helix-turn-helix domain-containing protein n=1 Tax=Marivirga tractuosa (strain ATCC 23168 / DSM 4126 / NBRC 15989 / NCIMB 1408 / VKM B-1430 / H-43) TaxID=643867 RepID=E4TMW0_MARTH|nr:helix-turn-helix domain-containing protein [Marivirga tractuosa]ADR21391.1 helix-turn-helix domain-containing protein [Marivirga tractuosa DSM 4126]BDD14155.1 hypothetical protein MATR_09800 [Marivirga tractuosa]
MEQDNRLVSIGAKLKELIKAKGYVNMEHFAHDHQINRVTLYKVLNGSNFQMSTFLKLLDALDIDMKNFFLEL